MKRQIVKEFVSIDLHQNSSKKESLTSILVNENSPVCDFLKKKIPTGNYNYLKTYDAWNRRIGNVTLKDLEATKEFLKQKTTLFEEYESSLLKPRSNEASDSKVQAMKDISEETLTNTTGDTENMTMSEVIVKEATCEQTNKEEKSDDTMQEKDDHVSLSDVDLAQKRKEEIQQWYTDALAQLQSQKESLRSEQFRRRKAQLRVEYWAKMDKEINQATPTVVMF